MRYAIDIQYYYRTNDFNLWYRSRVNMLKYKLIFIYFTFVLLLYHILKGHVIRFSAIL